MNRRFFIKSGSIALASFGVMTTAPSFLKRALAESLDKSGKRKTLIAIFQRGAVDGPRNRHDDHLTDRLGHERTC